jgi:hypothetical protein
MKPAPFGRVTALTIKVSRNWDAQIVPTEQGLRETFAYLRTGMDGHKQ